MSRYNYVIDPEAKNRQYDVNEWFWNSRTRKLELVSVYKLTGKQVKFWFGSTPREMIFQRPMWMYVPESMQTIIGEDKQLLCHFLEKTPIVPYSIDTLRYYAPENALLVDQVNIVPPRFKNSFQ